RRASIANTAECRPLLWLVCARFRSGRRHVVVEPLQPGGAIRDAWPRARCRSPASARRAGLLSNELLTLQRYSAGGGCDGGCDQPLVTSPPFGLRSCSSVSPELASEASASAILPATSALSPASGCSLWPLAS